MRHYKLFRNERHDDWVLLSGVVDQVSMATLSAISNASTDYGKNAVTEVTGNNHVDNSNEDSDSGEGVWSSGAEPYGVKERMRRRTL